MQQDFQPRGDERRAADLLEFPQAEFQAERKHQQNDAEFRQRIDGFLVVDERERRRVRADDEAGQNVAEHHRLFERWKRTVTNPATIITTARSCRNAIVCVCMI